MTSDRDLAREALAECARGCVPDADEKELEFDERLLTAVARAIGRGRDGLTRLTLCYIEVRDGEVMNDERGLNLTGYVIAPLERVVEQDPQFVENCRQMLERFRDERR